MRLTTTFIIGILILGAFLTFNHAMYVKHKTEIFKSIDRVASELLHSNYTSIVYISDSAKHAIAHATSYEIEWNDAQPPIGDGKADFRLITITDYGAKTGLRMKYDRQVSKYHVMGYWQLDKSETEK